MSDYSELKRQAIAVDVMYAAAKWSCPATIADASLGKTTAAYALAASPEVVVGLVTERDHLASEVQRITELRRLEWNSSQAQAATIRPLLSEMKGLVAENNKLNRGVQA